MPSCPVFNMEGKKTESLDLPDSIFGGRINQDVIHQAVVMYRAAQRQGTLKTKVRSEVSGGGKKPYRQKGTGRARAGSIRSPLWRKGGIIFGPQPRDFRFQVPQRIKIAALRESINAKYLDKDLLCVEDLNIKSNKTKDFDKVLSLLNIKGNRVLALLEGLNEHVDRVSRNIPLFQLMRADDVNAYDILCNKKILITKTAFKNLLKRIK